jgi:membrane protein YdbS with pleckstrin-like domain
MAGPLFLLSCALILVYLVIRLNVTYFDFTLSFSLHTFLVLLLLVIFVFQAFHIERQAKKVSYHFFENAVEIAHQPTAKAPHEYRRLLYKNIRNIKVRRTVIDMLFKTATLRLASDFELKAVPNPSKAYDLLQRMGVYARQYQ